MKIFPGDKFNFKRKILIVDDTEIGRCMLHDILEDEYEVLMAENGKEAIDIMHENAELLSIVLLDLVMPVMDGYEVMNAVGKDSILSKIPIIVLTAEQNAEVKSLKMGAADFIAKPYEFPEVIKARIAKTIQLYESKNLISATSTDALTGLFRREYFMNYAEVADQHEADTAKDAIVININRFRRINELYGREYADFILKEIGKTLQSYVRGKSAIACRVGIDSFYIYISHLENAEEILDELSDKVSVKKDNIQIRDRKSVV